MKNCKLTILLRYVNADDQQSVLHTNLLLNLGKQSTDI